MYNADNMKFVPMSKVFSCTSKRKNSYKKNMDINPSEVYEKVNKRLGITEMYLVDYTPVSEVTVGDYVYTSYHGNNTKKILSIEGSEILVNDTEISHLKEKQFLKKED